MVNPCLALMLAAAFVSRGLALEVAPLSAALPLPVRDGIRSMEYILIF